MRIGFLTYGLDRTPTGIGRYAIELLHALADIPHAPEIVLLSTEQEDKHGLWQKFEHYALPGCHLLPGLLTIGNLALSHAIQRYHLDIVHDPNGIAPFLGPALGAKRIVTIHDAFAYVYPQTHNRLDNWRYRVMLPVAARQAGAVLTVSHCSATDLTRYLKINTQRIKVIPNGIDMQFQPRPASQERQAILDRYGIQSPYILYLGGLNARKNIARLFAAYAQLRQTRPDVQLVIVGKRQWQTAEMDAALKQLDLGPFVHFTGYVVDADLPALYSAAEVFAFPSLYEGFGLPPLEAMACGTPVVTSNSSSLPEVVADAALTVDPYDIAGLAHALWQLLEDQSLRTLLRQRGLERSRLFSWERAARETIHVYEELFCNRLITRSPYRITHSNK